MLSMYTPVSDSILRSSILLEDLPTRWLWTVMLILADQTRETQGVVDCPVERLAQIANLTVEQTKTAIERLSSPDEKSRSKEAGGRRIEACENVEGFETRKWRLINWQKYKDEIRRTQMAAAARRYRQGKKLEDTVTDRHQPSSDRHPPSPSPSPSPSKNTEHGTSSPRPTRFSKPTMEELEAYIAEKRLQIDSVKFYAYYESNGWRVGKNPMHSWKAAVWNWSRT